MDLAKTIIAETLFVLGIFLIAYGLWTIYAPSGIIFLGAAVSVTSYLFVRARVPR
jgi:hypothetical protein